MDSVIQNAESKFIDQLSMFGMSLTQEQLEQFRIMKI